MGSISHYPGMGAPYGPQMGMQFPPQQQATFNAGPGFNQPDGIQYTRFAGKKPANDQDKAAQKPGLIRSMVAVPVSLVKEAIQHPMVAAGIVAAAADHYKGSRVKAALVTFGVTKLLNMVGAKTEPA